MYLCSLTDAAVWKVRLRSYLIRSEWFQQIGCRWGKGLIWSLERLHSERIRIYYLLTSATICYAILIWGYALDYNFDDTLILFSTMSCQADCEQESLNSHTARKNEKRVRLHSQVLQTANCYLTRKSTHPPKEYAVRWYKWSAVLQHRLWTGKKTHIL